MNQKIKISLLVLFATIVGSSFTSPKAKKAVLRHVVSFQFKDEVSPERRKQAVKDFVALEQSIPEIKKFEGGEDVSIEGHDKGFTHCFVLTFENEEGRSIYLSHPAHEEVANKNKPLMKDLFVVDYWGVE